MTQSSASDEEFGATKVSFYGGFLEGGKAYTLELRDDD